MIDSISGEVVRIDPDSVVIDTGGIAYAAFCPAGTIRSCSEGKTALLYTHLIARDDSVQLYGFSSPAERELFRQLLTVGQVGPRLAIQILSSLPPDAFVKAIGSGDIASLTKIKGIGRKTAERILVDLRDKVGPGGGEASRFILSSEEETALKALTSKSLGFSPREARMALERLRGEGLTAEGLVRRALEILGTGR
ncbi:Holliday junction branch migration protein RuvA [Candidatus Acetothermia bacterium]|nr:MAG: Holliday junction branch migration protein RuvA [Candidatus Acetothermia bacterium]